MNRWIIWMFCTTVIVMTEKKSSMNYEKSFKSQSSGNGIIRRSWRAKFGGRWKKGFETSGQHFVWRRLTAKTSEETKRRNTWRRRAGSSVPKVCSRLNDNVSVRRAQPFQVFLLKSKLPVFEAAEWLKTLFVPPVSFDGTEFLGDRGMFNFSF